ncbi:MAG TPA: NAD+ synthase [Alphaproteobacteria bacterium]|nr:NAD+ synthase [Alphaproteobacteria bacterium]
MTDRLAIALAQLNPTVGGIEANAERLLKARTEARGLGADLVLASELFISGYPPEDLVLKPAFIDSVRAAVERLADATGDGGPAMILGAPWREGHKVMNAGLLLDRGRVASVRYKHDLPNYGVFDEKRLFTPGPLPGPMSFRGVRLGVMICEDMWTPDATECLQESGAELLLVPNGSPFEFEKHDHRVQLAVARVTESDLPLIYVNQVGGQDELVFDGASFAVNADRSLAAQLPSFREMIALTRWRREGEGWICEAGPLEKPSDGLESIYAAMMLGLRDYVGKNRFPGVLLGLSGGIDSALTAVVAADALGPDKVHAVMMPSPFTSQESLEDAAEVAKLLGTRLDTVAIEPAMGAFEGMLKPLFDALPRDTTEENIQARARGITLMALSNKFGSMVLSTGNKSEMSVGYATLYGDMCGGYSVLKDVYKMTVFALARWRNQALPVGALGPAGRVIPERVIAKPPSAELKPNQTDQDTLPPYSVLDDILDAIIEHDLGVEDVVARGHDRATVLKVWRMVDVAEYKRRQAPPGVKITRRAFGRDRRYPITNAFRVR